MSNIIVEEGYPADFHLGFSMIFWFLLIFIAFCLGTIFIIKALKTQLINRRELYISYIIPSYATGAGFTIIQLGVFFPNFFIISISIAVIITMVSNTFAIYYLEKNLINLKKLPTIWSIFAVVLSFIDFIFIIILRIHFLDYIIILFIMLFFIISQLFLYILLIIFTKRVKGALRVRGFLIIFGLIFWTIAMITDHPPVVTLYPNIFLISSVCFIIGLIMIYFGIKGISDGITYYYNQEQICTIHRGKISKGNQIYLCPTCNTAYCLNCYEQVIKKEGCWNCQEGVKPEDEDKWEHEVISKIEVVKGFKKKSVK